MTDFPCRQLRELQRGKGIIKAIGGCMYSVQYSIVTLLHSTVPCIVPVQYCNVTVLCTVYIQLVKGGIVRSILFPHRAACIVV